MGWTSLCLSNGLLDLRALLGQQRAQDRAMAVRLVFAVATDREVRMMRERCEQIESPAVLGGRHLGPVFLQKSEPLTRSRSRLAGLHGFEAGRKVGKPHVIPVLRCKSGLGHTPRRTADCADSGSFAFYPLAA